MPEGDTLHRHAALLAPLLVGRTLTGVFEHGAPRPNLIGREVRTVEARGKHLVIELSEGVTIHVHLGMTGNILRRSAAEVDPRRFAASPLILKTTTAAVVLLKPRTLEILRTAFVHAHPVLSRLGPDLLSRPAPATTDPNVNVDVDAEGDIDAEADADANADEEGTAGEEGAKDPQLAEVLRRARALQSSRTIGELLLDQRVASGIGNVYKSELLFLERISPFALASSLDEATLLRLYRRAREMLAQNLGPWRRTTTADVSRGRLPRPGMGRHHVYRRKNRACHECGTPIASRPQGSSLRMTYYCPVCQGVG